VLAVQQSQEGITQWLSYIENLDVSVQKSQAQKDVVTEKRIQHHDALNSTKDRISFLKETTEEKYEVYLPQVQSKMEKERLFVIEPLEGVLELVPESEEDTSMTLPFYLKSEQLLDEQLQEQWQTLLDNGKERLQAIGEVNFIAISEHHTIRKQYDVLVAQKRDLEHSAEQIKDTINQLNDVCSERFLEAVAAVDKEFREIYPRLVGGGSSYIQLLDKENPLKTGVAIFAQPPGKKLDRLSLLSGGERAMVAISLLFSLFRVKPSPICLLDEVDAPLDEGNGGRFNIMLQEMATRAQFIVITHNKKTMEALDVLYGVSMPSHGVSQLVSVRLE